MTGEFTLGLGRTQEIRILSVSSTEDDHAAIFRILDELPFAVTPARSCREAAGALAHGHFGIILCASDLPDGSWLEILNQISGAREKPLLIVTSRLADESLWAEVLNLGGYDLLAKPFSHQEVRHVLTSAWVQKALPVHPTQAASVATS
uniref:Response regulator receiver protein n=1 Tax=Solibacter usitatus (strain Ellin6076) TaxID=234267 RepID=Q023H3_SOLUE